MRPLTLLLLAGLVAGCASRTYTEAEFKRAPITQCTAGDCRNGVGTLRYLDGTEITGARVNGEQVAGTYEIRWPCLPGKTVTITYDAARQPVSGTVVRACVPDTMAMSKPPRAATFTGSFATLNNPFTRETVSSYKSGTYTDGRGVSWEGEFDYIPIRDSVVLPGYGKTFTRSGAFVFVGAKIDPELDEVVRGLFISEPTRPEQDIRLIRARPDYLEALRSTFVADRAANAAELAEEKRASREAFNTFLGLATSAAVIYGSSRAMAAADRATLESMTGLIRGERSPAAAGSRTPSNAGEAASARAPSPISVAEFRRLQGAANSAAPDSRSTASPAAAPTAGAKRSYPGLPVERSTKRDETFTGKSKADAWCAKKTQALRDEFVGSGNDLLSVGACSCGTATNSVANTMPGVFAKEYYCQFDFRWRQNVPDYTSR